MRAWENVKWAEARVRLQGKFIMWVRWLTPCSTHQHCILYLVEESRWRNACSSCSTSTSVGRLEVTSIFVQIVIANRPARCAMQRRRMTLFLVVDELQVPLVYVQLRRSDELGIRTVQVVRLAEIWHLTNIAIPLSQVMQFLLDETDALVGRLWQLPVNED